MNVRFQTLAGKWIKFERTEWLQANQGTTEKDGDGGHGNGNGNGNGGAETSSTTIAAVREKLREVSQANSDPEKKVAAASGRRDRTGSAEDWDTGQKIYQEVKARTGQSACTVQEMTRKVQQQHHHQQHQQHQETERGVQNAAIDNRGVAVIAVEQRGDLKTQLTKCKEDKIQLMSHAKQLKTQLAQAKADNTVLIGHLEDLTQAHCILLAQIQQGAEPREVGNAASDGGVGTSTVEKIEKLKTQLAQCTINKTVSLEKLQDLGQDHHTLLGGPQAKAAVNATSSHSTDTHRLREAKQELAAANEKVAALNSRCLIAEEALESTKSSLNNARQEFAEEKSSMRVTIAKTTAAAATDRQMLKQGQQRFRAEWAALNRRIRGLTAELLAFRERREKKKAFIKLETKTADKKDSVSWSFPLTLMFVPISVSTRSL